MAEFSIQIRGMDQIRRAMRTSPKVIVPILQKAVIASGAVLAKHSLKGDPIPYKTGLLLSSFRYSTGSLIGRWFPTARYAVFVHEGTRPHIIRARNKRVLANVKEGKIFGRTVRHPGTKPNRFMLRLKDKSERDINRLFGQALEVMARDIAFAAR